MGLVRRVVGAVRAFFHIPLVVVERARVRRLLRPDVRRKLRQQGGGVVFPNGLRKNPLLTGGGYAIEKIFLVLGLEPRQFDPWDKREQRFFLDWQDLTKSGCDSVAYMVSSCSYTNNPMIAGRDVINSGVRDISKKKVAESFLTAFGHPLDVDPTRYEGEIVVKDDRNASHDGVVVRGPIPPRRLKRSKVYNRLVENLDAGGNAVDLRLPFINRPTDFFYKKSRSIDNRFSNTNDSVSLERTEAFFSREELEKIVAFCRLMGLDYGELDCLRDRASGELFIVDVAKTPAGPPNGLVLHDRLTAIRRMAVSFATEFIGTPPD